MATAEFTALAAKVLDDPIDVSDWADLRDDIGQLAGAHRNLLTNGGFEVGQRGAGPFTAAGAWTLDRWQIGTITGGKTVTVTPEVTTTDGSAQSMKIVAAGTFGSILIRQKLENLQEVRGREVSLSVRVHQSAANGCAALYYANGSAETDGATSATTGSFVTLTLTVTPSASATSIEFGIAITANGTYYVDNAMLVIGPAPAPYRPLHPQEELARCQRYYEVHGGVNDEWPLVGGYANAGSVNRNASFSFAVTKGGVPTVTKNGTWAVNNCGQPSVLAATPNGYTLTVVSTAGGETSAYPNSADDTIVATWEP